MSPLDSLIGWLNLIVVIGDAHWKAYVITMMIVGVGYLIWKRRQKMISGVVDNPTVAKLQQSNFNFYLTGSRFFETAKAESDYDFFVEASREVRRFLQSLGFFMDWSADYLEEVWAHSSHIHVQLVGDAEDKLAAQELIQENFHSLLYSLGKEQKKLLWQGALDTVRDVQRAW
jgi:hypothetical protein